MIKRYMAYSHVCINVALNGGGVLHVAFEPITGGGSVFYTADSQVQEALENHNRFGKLFFLDEEISEEVQGEKEKETPVSEEAKDGDNDTQGTLQEITVTCADDAKDYLSEHFGVSRTKMRSIKAIQEVASVNGIVFVGL